MVMTFFHYFFVLTDNLIFNSMRGLFYKRIPAISTVLKLRLA